MMIQTLVMNVVIIKLVSLNQNLIIVIILPKIVVLGEMDLKLELKDVWIANSTL